MIIAVYVIYVSTECIVWSPSIHYDLITDPLVTEGLPA